MQDTTARLLPERAVTSLETYVAGGGGLGLRRALGMAPREVRAEVRDSGLRGRGGAGFPTGLKWSSITDAASPADEISVVCNAAEGEPGTYKDRVLMEANPYRVIEGVLIALHATGAKGAFIGIKERFARPLQRLIEARDAMADTRWEGAAAVRIVPGPDAYLFGEESAMLEVIEHKLAMPRILPPYQQGLFATMHQPNPTVVNNVETLSHVTAILTHGAAWFRSIGTEETPGSMVFTVVGDVANPGVYELPMGTPLRRLIEDIAGARDVLAIYPGTSNAVITPGLLDLPMDFDSFREAGTGLGSGGFVVYDTSRDIVQVCRVLAEFLAMESCGQCLPCKLGTADIFERLDKLVRGAGTRTDIEAIGKQVVQVTEANRCYLPVGAQLLVGSTLEQFPEAFEASIGNPSTAAPVPIPKIDSIDEATGDVHYYR